MSILTSGCFDGIHAGHVAFFQRLQAIVNQPVYVAVASDEYIRRAKGHDPRSPEGERLRAVKGLKGVQDAFLHGVDGVWEIVRNGPPWAPGTKWSAIAKGCDWIEKADLFKGENVIFVDSGSDLHSSDRD